MTQHSQPQPEPIFIERDGEVVLTIQQGIYRLEALLTTAYWFTDHAYLFIESPEPSIFKVHLRPKSVTLERPHVKSALDLAGEFANALLDHEMRCAIEERTGVLREILVTRAMAGLRSPSGTDK